MDKKPPVTNQNSFEAEAAKQADRLNRQTQASAMAAEAINKTQNSAQNENPREVRNVRKSPSIDSGYSVNQKGESPHATTDERYRHSAYKDKVLGPTGLNEKAAKTPAETKKSSFHLRPEARALQRRLAASKLGAPFAQTRDIVARLKATQISSGALAWAGYLWLGIQVPFALISIISFGVSVTLEAVSKGEGGFFSWVGGKLIEGVGAITSIIGIDFAEISSTLFLFSQVIILALGLICIFVLYMQYKLAGLNPFFGRRGSGFKIGMFLLTIIGYSMPVLNLLPFVFLWMLAVWMYPR